MQLQLSARDVLKHNPIFELLNTSSIKLGNSYRSAKHRYDFKCLHCYAIFSDHITTNNAGPSKRPTEKIRNLLHCGNCGISWDADFGKLKQTEGKFNRFRDWELTLKNFTDTNEYEYNTESPVITEYDLDAGTDDERRGYNVRQPVKVSVKGDKKIAESKIPMYKGRFIQIGDEMDEF